MARSVNTGDDKVSRSDLFTVHPRAIAAGAGIAIGMGLLVLGAIKRRDNATMTNEQRVRRVYPGAHLTVNHDVKPSRYRVWDGHPSMPRGGREAVVLGESRSRASWAWAEAAIGLEEKGGIKMWTYRSTGQTPAAVATVYAAQTFDPPREIESCWGAWDRGGYVGHFRLKDGVRRYKIDGKHDGTWTVEPEENR